MNFTIREMCKTTGQVPPEAIADKTLDELTSGGDVKLEDNKSVTITKTGETVVSPTSGKDAMKKVTATVTIKLFAWKDGSDNIAYTLKETPAANDTCYLAAATGLDDDKVKAYAEGKITVTISAADVEFSRYSTGDITL